jgi:hypothetical protein
VPLGWKPGARQPGSGAQLNPFWDRDLHPLPRASHGFTKRHQSPGLQPPAVASVGRNGIWPSFTPHAVMLHLAAYFFCLSQRVLVVFIRVVAYLRRTIVSDQFAWPRSPPVYVGQSLAETCSPMHVTSHACTLRRHRCHHTEVSVAYAMSRNLTETSPAERTGRFSFLVDKAVCHISSARGEFSTSFRSSLCASRLRDFARIARLRMFPVSGRCAQQMTWEAVALQFPASRNFTFQASSAS